MAETVGLVGVKEELMKFLSWEGDINLEKKCSHTSGEMMHSNI
jgi:hypothetical protein